MQSLIGNILAAIAMVATVVLFEFGFMAPGDAFFVVGFVVLLFTANQLIARENQQLRDAIVSMFTAISFRWTSTRRPRWRTSPRRRTAPECDTASGDCSICC